MSEGFQDNVFGDLNDKQRKSIATIERSGRHLLELINDILDLSKIESGKLELQISDVPIVSLCEGSLAFIKQMAHKKAIEIHTSIPKDIKNIQGDNLRLRQILINLLCNAVKFTPDGGSITLKVRVEEGEQFTTDIKEIYPENHQKIKETSGIIAALSAYSRSIPIPPSSQRLCFSVIDTGIGIAEEDMSKLFQAFVQIDSSLNRQYSGTGLGLALVERITTLHGGTVSVTSQVGKGSCFSIHLPYHAGSEVLQREAGSQLPNQSLSEHLLNSPISVPETALKDSLILLAEDNPANIDTISGYLEGRGYRVIVAKDGYEAISLAQTEDPNLILMDIQMPGMDGLEAMRHIRNGGQTQMPIVALTALAMSGDREKCIEAGANEYLTKPIKFKQLTATIQKLLLNAEGNRL
jgi:CheY-like chemotaxis protein